MERFSSNDVLNYFFQEISDLFTGGALTATVYTDIKQRVDVAFSTTHGAITLHCPFEYSTEICGPGLWAGKQELLLTAYILAKDRSVAYAILERLEGFLEQGKFQDDSLAPPDGPSVLMYTEHRTTGTYPVDSELYGLRLEFAIFFFRALRA